MKKIMILASMTILLQGCSNPFGQNSLIDSISDGISSIFGKTESNLVAGGAQQFQTSSAYKGSVSVGNYINQTQQVTNGGYRVMTTIK